MSTPPIPDRADVRRWLAQLAEAELTGESGPFQAIYRSRVEDAGGQSPVMVIASAGSKRPALTLEGAQAIFDLELHLLTLYTDEQSGYSAQDADDTLDACEAAVASMLARHRRVKGQWRAIEWIESTIDSVMIGGDQYWDEIVRVAVHVY